MLTTLEAVVDRLIQAYEPERIILFGSRAQGTARPDSDVDMLIVKDTDRRPIDRRMDVERLLLDRRPGLALDVVVYTPRELRDSYLAGSPFIEEIMETGTVLFMRKITAVWMHEAEDDERAANLLLVHGHLRAACLHGHQAVEKALKALLLEREQRPPHAHDLVTLRDLVRQAGVDIAMSGDELVFLNNVYLGRYPSEAGLLPHGEPTEEDARRALRAATIWLIDVRRAIAESDDAGSGRQHIEGESPEARVDTRASETDDPGEAKHIDPSRPRRDGVD